MNSSDNAQIGNQLPISVDFTGNENDFKNTLDLTYKRIANSNNTRTNGLYTLVEIGNSNQYFKITDPQSFRNVYRKTFDIVNLNGGNILGGATVVFPHGITGLADSALIYASCVSTEPRYFTVVDPYIYLLGANIVFVNPRASPLTRVNAVCEYLKE